MILAIYRSLLWVLPPAFRVAYADCMTADFEDGLADALRFSSRRHLGRWLGLVALDLLRTLAWQWLRTPVPWLTTLYATALVTFCEGLASVLLARQFVVPVVLLPVVSGLTFVLWFVLPNLRRQPDRSIRA